MGKVTKSSMSKYDQMFAKATAPEKEKKEAKRFTAGKAQALIEAAYWDKTKDGNEIIKWELKILTGEDKGRTIKRTHFLVPNKTDWDGNVRTPEQMEAETMACVSKFKEELSKLGVSETKTINESLETLEECTIEISVWFSPKKPENYPIAFFQKFIKGPEGSEAEEAAASDDDDDLEY
jgi:hypothetical protein